MNTKLKCLLLDDELPGLAYLKMLCEEIPELEVVKAFQHPAIFLAEIPNLNFDLCIIDIEMPGMNGLEVAAQLDGKPVIFTTAYKDYAAEAFDIDAVDYVRKPVSKERLEQAVIKAKNRLLSQETDLPYIQLYTDSGKTIIYIDELAHISAASIDSRDKKARLLNGTVVTIKKYVVRKTIITPARKGFCKDQQKRNDPVKRIRGFSHNEVTTNIMLANGQPLKLILSAIYRDSFIQKLKI